MCVLNAAGRQVGGTAPIRTKHERRRIYKVKAVQYHPIVLYLRPPRLRERPYRPSLPPTGRLVQPVTRTRRVKRCRRPPLCIYTPPTSFCCESRDIFSGIPSSSADHWNGWRGKGQCIDSRNKTHRVRWIPLRIFENRFSQFCFF